MQRGTLNSTHTGMTGTPAREMDYTLDIVGNWNAYVTKTGGTTDLSQTRTQNKANEITAIGGTPGWATPPVYDPAGNMTSMPQVATPTTAFTATYDAWNRMTSLGTTGGGVATYQYDGRNRRIVKNTTAPSETRHFYWTDNWQDIEERVGTTTPTTDVQYVGGVRYIDELVCRDDATPQRLYAMQDANFNLTSICDTSGAVQERYLFDPYGNRAVMNSSWSVISASAFAWVVGHQGLMHDAESGLIYNRFRYLLPPLGRFGSRDPIGDADGMNLYEDRGSNTITNVDPIGDRWGPVKPTTPKPKPTRPEKGTCKSRMRCNFFHCGLVIWDSDGNYTAVDGAGSRNNDVNQGPDGQNYNGIIINPKKNLADATGESSRWESDWDVLPKDVCDCLTSNEHRRQFNSDQIAAGSHYHLFGPNSNHSIKCFAKQCGLTFSWFIKPPGWGPSDASDCDTCTF